MHPEWKDRVTHWIEALQKELYQPLGAIALEGFCTYEQLSLEEALARPAAPMPVGTRWGHMWEYAWFKGEIVLPEEAQGQRIVMDLLPGGESTLFVNGEVFGTRRADWVREKHHFLCDQFLTLNGVPGTRYELAMESYAGQSQPPSALGPVRQPEDEWHADERATRTEMGPSTFGIWHEDAYQLYMDVKLLSDMLIELEGDSLLAASVEEALQQFTLLVDFEQPRERRTEDYRCAREALRSILDSRNGTVAPEFYAIGHAHLDLCYLWPYRETQRKVARTFAQQLRLMEMYPDYKFIQSQPETYQICKELYPALYGRVKQKIKEGQWIAEGSMWVEPDTNMSGGEALIRQLLYGKRFYKEEFGVECEMLWLPDTFGYSAVLPQILRGCGVKYLTTQKIFWTYNGGDRFPYHYFIWQGMDGSQITSFLHMDYNSDTTAHVVMRRFKERVQRQGLRRFLLPCGYGDGGGGPARDHIENVLREKDMQGVPRVRFASPKAFFEDCAADAAKPPRYVGELYFQCHRGTYTSQALMKKHNRLSELALRDGEMWAAAAMLRTGKRTADFEKAWKLVLRNQFHDILPGSSIARVYEDALQWYDAAERDIAEQTARAQSLLVTTDENQTTFFNSLSWERTALVERGGRLVQITLPACGFSSHPPVREAPLVPVTCRMEAGCAVLDNGVLCAKINRMGEVTSLVEKTAGRNCLSASGNQLRMYKDVPRRYDAWDIDSVYELSPVELSDENASIRILETDPWRATVRIERRISNSAWTQDVSLEAESRQLTFRTEVEWHECHRLLKTVFPTGIHADSARNEIQFGFVERPTHRSRMYDADRFEVCNHRYTVLHDENCGAAVLNDCKYGVSMLGDEIALTLLRASKAPDPQADTGRHTFNYAYYVWSDASFLHSGVVQRGWELNVPIAQCRGASETCSLLSTNRSNIIAETIKAAEDGSGDLIVRLYEACRAQTAAHVRVAAKAAWLTDMLENNLEELPVQNGGIRLSFRPFEIKTLRIHPV